MPILNITKVRYYRTTILREARKLLGIDEDDVIGWVFKESKIIRG